MKKSLRPIASILVITGVLLVSAAPVTAAPRVEPFSDSAVPALRLVTELWSWAGSWLGELPIESAWRPGGAGVDPDGQPATANGPAPGPGDTESAGRADASGPDA